MGGCMSFCEKLQLFPDKESNRPIQKENVYMDAGFRRLKTPTLSKESQHKREISFESQEGKVIAKKEREINEQENKKDDEDLEKKPNPQERNRKKDAHSNDEERKDATKESFKSVKKHDSKIDAKKLDSEAKDEGKKISTKKLSEQKFKWKEDLMVDEDQQAKLIMKNSTDSPRTDTRKGYSSAFTQDKSEQQYDQVEEEQVKQAKKSRNNNLEINDLIDNYSNKLPQKQFSEEQSIDKEELQIQQHLYVKDLKSNIGLLRVSEKDQDDLKTAPNTGQATALGTNSKGSEEDGLANAILQLKNDVQKGQEDEEQEEDNQEKEEKIKEIRKSLQQQLNLSKISITGQQQQNQNNGSRSNSRSQPSFLLNNQNQYASQAFVVNYNLNNMNEDTDFSLLLDSHKGSILYNSSHPLAGRDSKFVLDESIIHPVKDMTSIYYGEDSDTSSKKEETNLGLRKQHSTQDLVNLLQPIQSFLEQNKYDKVNSNNSFSNQDKNRTDFNDKDKKQSNKPFNKMLQSDPKIEDSKAVKPENIQNEILTKQINKKSKENSSENLLPVLEVEESGNNKNTDQEFSFCVEEQNEIQNSLSHEDISKLNNGQCEECNSKNQKCHHKKHMIDYSNRSQQLPLSKEDKNFLSNSQNSFSKPLPEFGIITSNSQIKESSCLIVPIDTFDQSNLQFEKTPGNNLQSPIFNPLGSTVNDDDNNSSQNNNNNKISNEFQEIKLESEEQSNNIQIVVQDPSKVTTEQFVFTIQALKKQSPTNHSSKETIFNQMSKEATKHIDTDKPLKKIIHYQSAPPLQNHEEEKNEGLLDNTTESSLIKAQQQYEEEQMEQKSVKNNESTLEQNVRIMEEELKLQNAVEDSVKMNKSFSEILNKKKNQDKGLMHRSVTSEYNQDNEEIRNNFTFQNNKKIIKSESNNNIAENSNRNSDYIISPVRIQRSASINLKTRQTRSNKSGSKTLISFLDSPFESSFVTPMGSQRTSLVVNSSELLQKRSINNSNQISYFRKTSSNQQNKKTSQKYYDCDQYYQLNVIDSNKLMNKDLLENPNKYMQWMQTLNLNNNPLTVLSPEALYQFELIKQETYQDFIYKLHQEYSENLDLFDVIVDDQEKNRTIFFRSELGLQQERIFIITGEYTLNTPSYAQFYNFKNSFEQQQKLSGYESITALNDDLQNTVFFSTCSHKLLPKPIELLFLKHFSFLQQNNENQQGQQNQVQQEQMCEIDISLNSEEIEQYLKQNKKINFIAPNPVRGEIFQGNIATFYQEQNLLKIQVFLEHNFQNVLSVSSAREMYTDMFNQFFQKLDAAFP